MKKLRIKKFLDYIPLIILILYAVNLVWVRFDQGVLITWRNWIALLLLPLNCLAFSKNQQAGVLTLGFILLVGLFGIAQFSPGVSISYAGFSAFDKDITIFYGQPIFILWLLVHFILSGRYYFGIITKKYWTEFASSWRKTSQT
jgi:hypothetical protein